METSPTIPSRSDDAAFETKFAAIARRAFHNDKNDPRLAREWSEAVSRLGEGDFYIPSF
jgi:hypothetical protein